METKSPAVLWYTSDFLTGTMLMSDEQLGKYTKLLCYQHQQGHLSEEDMMMICKTYDKKIFDKFVKDKEGNFFNKRMDLEIEKRNNFSKSRSENRRGNPNKTTEKSKKDMKNICKSYVKHMDNENDNENINRIINDYFNNKDILKSSFEEFRKIRKKLKAIDTPRSITLVINDLKDKPDIEQLVMIEKATKNSWKSFYELNQQEKIKLQNKTPDWFNKKIGKESITEEEEKELEDLLKEFK